MQNLKKILLGFLGIGLLFLSPLGVSAQGDRTPALNQPIQSVELLNQRSPYTKAFRNLDGSISLMVSGNPIHYQTSLGTWEEIDPVLQSATGEVDDEGAAYGFKAVKNTFQAYFSRRGNGWVALRSGRSGLGFKLVSAGTGSFRRLRDGISAPEVLNNCDLNYFVQAGKIKEELIATPGCLIRREPIR
jgi:hypothetical protein